MTRENSGVARAKFRNTASYKIQMETRLYWIKVFKEKTRIFGSPMLVLKITTLYRFQKSINKGNTKVNDSLLNLLTSVRILALVSACAYSSFSDSVQNASFIITEITVNVVSWFGKEQNNLVSQSKLFDTIVRPSFEISVRMTSWHT